MTQPAARVAQRLHELLFGLRAPDTHGKSTLEDQNAADWIEVYYRPGGVGPRRVLSVRADVLYGEPGH